jgi:hypothetical protein
MPLPFALLLAISLGAAFARAARAEIVKSDGPLATSRPMLVVCAFAGLVALPVVAYFAAFHGDWAYLYLVPWKNVPSAVDLALVVLAGALVPAGFAAAAPLLRAKRARALDALVFGPLGVVLVLALVFARRLAVSASHAQYVGGYGVEPIGSSALGKGVLLGLLAIGAGAAWTLRELRAPT